MADDYLGKKMEEYRSHRSTRTVYKTGTLARLVTKNRSYRGYDPSFIVRNDQLRHIIDIAAKIPSARNQQVLRFRPVLSDQAGKVLKHIHLGGALPEMKLPLPGTEPNAFIIVCSTEPENRYVDMDLGIAVQTMLLQAVEIGLNGLCIGSFDKKAIVEEFALPLEPLLILAIGKGKEKIELTEIAADGDHRYYRRDGVHYVPKISPDDLLIE